MSLILTIPSKLHSGWEKASKVVRQTLSEDVLNFLKKHAGADLLIVTGDAGAGKTTFIKSITGADLYVSYTLESGTRMAALVPAVIEGRRYMFLDMPGLNTVDFDDWEVFRKLMHALATVRLWVNFRGVLYVDSLKENRITPASEKTLTWLSHFCGRQFMPNVTMITTKWDGLDTDGIQDKLARFAQWNASELFGRLFSPPGAKVYHCGLVQVGQSFQTLHHERKIEERKRQAMRMIVNNYGAPSDLRLQIYDEIGAGATIEETSAGRWLGPPSPSQGAAASSPTDETNAGDARHPNSDHEDEGEASDPHNSGPPPPPNEPGNQRPPPSFWGNFTWSDARPFVRLLTKAFSFYMGWDRVPPHGEGDRSTGNGDRGCPEEEQEDDEPEYHDEENSSSGWWCSVM